MRIFLVDDHPVVLESLQNTLSAVKGFEVVGTARSRKQLLEHIKEVSIDLLVLDMDLPDASGIEVVRWLRQEYPALAVLIFSMHQEVEVIRLAYRFGARGFVRKSTPLETLVAAIRTIQKGELAFDSFILRDEPSIIPPEQNQEALHHSLSERELQILVLMAQGLSQKEICGRLQLQQSTVGTYMVRIRSKLGLHSLADLVSYCKAHGLRGE